MGYVREGFLAAAMTLAVTAAPAGAATMQAVFTGTVYSGYDQTGVFGAPGGSLANLGYTLRYVYDTSLGTRLSAGAGTVDDLYGGSVYGTATPTVSATLTIGSVTQSVGGSYESRYQLCNIGYCAIDQYYTSAADYTSQPDGGYTYNGFNAIVSDYTDFLPDNLDTPFSVMISALAQQYGYFQFATVDGTTGLRTTFANGYLSLDRLSVSQVDIAPIPLPASGLLLLGAGAGLAAIRRRRRQAA